MTEVQKIIEEAQSRIREITNTEVQLVIKPDTHKHLELYGQTWMLCYRVALDHLPNEKEQNVYQHIMNAQYCYAKIITDYFKRLRVVTGMHIIGRDRTNYYNLYKCAEKFIQAKDARFMSLYEAIVEALLKSDLLSKIEKANA